ncbi:MAG: rhodanese-like domain-containing protein [Blastocatellia bacterium]
MKKIPQLLLGALVMATAMLGLACNKLYANGGNGNAADPKASTATAPAPPASDNPEDKMPRVKVQDAIKEVADGTAVVIDVRGTDAYKLAHIKGALDVPLTKLEGNDFKGLPKDKRIIAYCT